MTAEIIGFDDLDPNMAETDDPRQQLAQDLYHRLIEERGSNPDDPDRGLGLPQRVNGTVNDDALERDTVEELRKDRRVDVGTVSAKVTRTTNGNRGATVRLDVVAYSNAQEIRVGIVFDDDGFRRVA